MKILTLLLFFLGTICSIFAENLLKNPQFLPDKNGNVPHWQKLDNKVSFFIENGFLGGGSLQNKRAADFALCQELTFQDINKNPIVFSGESLAQKAGFGGDYCLYLDIYYADGSIKYGVKAKWKTGTHSWEKAIMCFYPDKKVKKVILSVLLRNSTGKALFRNIKLSRKEPGPILNYYSLLSLAPFKNSNYRLDLGFFKYVSFEGKFLDKKGTVLESFKGRGKTYRKEFSFKEIPATLVLITKDKNNTLTFTQKISKNINNSVYNTLPKKITVSCANSMAKISPVLSTLPKFTNNIQLQLAGHEYESLQIVISNNTNKKVSKINCSVGKLVTSNGLVFPGEITFNRIGYLPRTIPFATHPEQLNENTYWLPDVLLPMVNFSVPQKSNAGIFVTVYAPKNTPKGIYKGTVTITSNNQKIGEVNLSVRVFGFNLPQKFSYKSAFSLMDGFLEFYYPDRLPLFRRKAMDIMLDHRLNPDDITRTQMPQISDLLYAKTRGMNSFNILHLVPQPKKKVLWTLWAPVKAYNEKLFDEFRNRLDDYIKQLEVHNLKDMAYFYGFDERRKDAFNAITKTRDFVKKRWNIPLMSTSTMFQELARDPNNQAYKTCDWYCPLTNFYNPILADQLRKEGHQVWVYTCCGPEYPYVNFANLEYPFINARQIAWQVYALKADGFLYWHVNNWRRNRRMYIDETVNFQRFYLHDKFALNATGDGELIYPGKNDIYPSIRLANLRDGSEDYDYLKLLEIKNPKLAIKFAKEICPGRKNSTQDNQKILDIRRKIAEILER